MRILLSYLAYSIFLKTIDLQSVGSHYESYFRMHLWLNEQLNTGFLFK